MQTTSIERLTASYLEITLVTVISTIHSKRKTLQPKKKTMKFVNVNNEQRAEDRKVNGLICYLSIVPPHCFFVL